MSDYPAHYESDILLRDGSSLHLRPIKPDDLEALLEFHNRLSPKSIYFRYFSPLPELGEERAKALVNVDYDDTFALVGELAGRLVGVARYYRDEKTRDHAEVAFLIEDALQGRGIATRMLDRLAEIARDKDISTFEAYVLGDNRKMMDVFMHTGFEVERRLDGGVFQVTFPITSTPAYEEQAALRVDDEETRHRYRPALHRPVGDHLVASDVEVAAAERVDSQHGHAATVARG